jgi:hypothetical protein
MIKSVLGTIFLVGLLTANVAAAGDCAKTLMGNDCETNAKGVSSHLRGNAVENAKAAKELKVTQAKAKKAASAIASVQN